MVVKIRKKFCLTFDIEEFDIPREISEEEKYQTSFEGTKNILNVLKEENITATFFITQKFAEKYPKVIREIAKHHEVGSHGYSHSQEYSNMQGQAAYEMIKKSKEYLEKITKEEVIGFRAPRMRTVNPFIVKKAGFKYDASSLPAAIPGRYKDFFHPRKINQKEGLTIIPTSVTPIVKIPLMWYGFRNFGLVYAKIVTSLSTINNEYASVYFHSWEFADISKYKVREGIKRNTGKKAEEMLREFTRWCAKKYEFTTMREMIKNHDVTLSTN